MNIEASTTAQINEHLDIVVKTDSTGAISHCVHAGGPSVNKTHLFCSDCVDAMREVAARRGQDDLYDALSVYCSASLAARASLAPLSR